MNEYLQATEFTDSTSPAIRQAASTITRDANSRREEAVCLFRWVQDHARYTLGLFPHTASETLLRAHGSCSNKANLLVALARSRGFPAAFRVMVVNAKEYFGPAAHPRLQRLLSRRSLHIYAALYLDGEWLDADPSDDVRLSLAGEHIWPQTRRVHFDGTAHARLNLHPDHIIEYPGDYQPSIDPILRKTPTKGNDIIRTFNDYTEFLRRRLVIYETWTTVFDDFMDWYSTTLPDRHAAFLHAEATYLAREHQPAE